MCEGCVCCACGIEGEGQITETWYGGNDAYLDYASSIGHIWKERDVWEGASGRGEWVSEQSRGEGTTRRQAAEGALEHTCPGQRHCSRSSSRAFATMPQCVPKVQTEANLAGRCGRWCGLPVVAPLRVRGAVWSKSVYVWATAGSRMAGREYMASSHGRGYAIGRRGEGRDGGGPGVLLRLFCRQSSQGRPGARPVARQGCCSTNVGDAGER